MQRETGATPTEKTSTTQNTKTPVQDDEIRVSASGRLTRYIIYAGTLFNEKNKRRVIIKATGTAIMIAITLAEILKRRIGNLHQQNFIGITRTTRVINNNSNSSNNNGESENQTVTERYVPFIEIVMALDDTLVDTKSEGYQPPIDQTLVKPFSDDNRSRPVYRFRGGGRPTRMGRSYPGQGSGGSAGRGYYSDMSRPRYRTSRNRRFQDNEQPAAYRNVSINDR